MAKPPALRKLGSAPGGGFASSYTLPFLWQGHPEAFIFFNSRGPGAFPESCLDELDLWAHLVGMLVVAERASLKALLAALRTANQMIHLRDPETGGHLERMAVAIPRGSKASRSPWPRGSSQW